MNLLLPARALPRRSRAIALLGLSLSLIASSIPLAAQTAAPAPLPPPATAVVVPASDEVVALSPFTVSADNADRYRAAEAISAVRVRAALIDTPSSISVITRDMMDDLSPNRVFDVTKYVAGVQEGRGVQFQDRMIIRGFETQNGARLVDNFLQPADADNVEEAIIDRIEVTKGPNAILSPAGAPGGSLNIITKSPTWHQQGSLTAQIGVYDAQKVTLDTGGPLSAGSPFAYRLVGSYQNTARYWSSDPKMKNWSFAPMLSWRINTKSMLSLKYVYAEHWIPREPLFILSPDTTASSGDPKLLPGIDPSSLNGIQPWSHVGTASHDFFAVYTTSFNEHINLRVAGNYRHYHEDSDQNFLSTPGLNYARYNPMTGELTQDYTWALQNPALAYNAATNPYVSTFSQWINTTNIPNRGNIQDTNRATTNFQADLAGNYQFGVVSSQTVLGAAYSKQDATSFNKDGTMPGINLLAPAAAYPNYPAAWPTNLGSSGSSYKNTQYYASERLGFFNNRLYLTGGVMSYATVTKNWNEVTHGAATVLDDSKSMWTAGALYKITEHYSAYYNHSTNAAPVIANNLPLWREGVQDEFGVKSEFFNHRLSVNLAYFEIAQTNVTVPNPAYQTDPTQPQTLVSDLTNKGFEVELMGSVTKNLSAIATYSHLHMRDALDRMVRMVADDNASLLLNYRFDEGAIKGLNVNFGLTYSGKRAGDTPDTSGTSAANPYRDYTPLHVLKQVSFYTQPQYTTTLGASYRMNEHWMYRLIIDNLFDDADYISVGGGRITGTGLTTQPGINARLSVTYNF
jgi:iron complex outermembrane receptor protein